MTRGAAWPVYLALSGLVVVIYFAVPADAVQTVLVGLLGASAAVAIVLGVRWHRPAVRWPWYLMAAARLLFAVAEVLYWIQTALWGRDAFPSYSDVLYLAFSACLVVAIAGLVRARRPGRDLPGLLDAAILSTGAALLAWVYLIVPYVRADDLSPLARAVSLAYPVADIAMLAVLLRLATGRGNRPAAYRLFAASMVVLLLGDVVYALLELSIGYHPGHPVDAAWLIMQALGGAAALHPSMATLSRPEPATAHTPVSPGRLAALAVASLMAPAVLAIEWVRDMPIDVPVIVAGSAILFLLVIARLEGVVRLQTATLRTAEILASTDQLTGLANRRRFHDRWQASLDAPTGPTALLYIDLDGFKPVNDAHGHATGDAVLTAVADRIRTTVRADDVVARLGGDEFAVILPVTDDARATQVAARILAALDAPIATPAGPIRVGASIGMITAPPGSDAEQQLRRADAAMYAAKAAGRNRLHHAADAP
ncbi:GGDEF domain-containing protein [Catenuloplanes indicus]|uniref:Diguanylate cyclase (GGDEF)-like protein n=1 Tax=Catenuloplanes indicus TaxID=137267 RepID=A0AAE3VVU2_9ACTN|nr:GGDEF domain-containing protein [Catenuloplanes indicus]MDQ0363910.1 diguanylate cyclase (GGDEF)-like protein [Catenuloplanes indicus]